MAIFFGSIWAILCYIYFTILAIHLLFAVEVETRNLRTNCTNLANWRNVLHSGARLARAKSQIPQSRKLWYWEKGNVKRRQKGLRKRSEEGLWKGVLKWKSSRSRGLRGRDSSSVPYATSSCPRRPTWGEQPYWNHCFVLVGFTYPNFQTWVQKKLYIFAELCL